MGLMHGREVAANINRGDPVVKVGLPLVVLVILAMLGAILPVSAQQPGRMYRVGLLNPNSPTIAAKYVQAFQDELRRLGYAEGNNLVLERRYADGQAIRLKGLANELAQQKIDVFFAPTEPALVAAKEEGGGVPIVTVTCDPIEKLIGSLARPGGNATGFSCVSSSLAGKRLGLSRRFLAQPWHLPPAYSAASFGDHLGVRRERGARWKLGASRYARGLLAKYMKLVSTASHAQSPTADGATRQIRS